MFQIYLHLFQSQSQREDGTISTISTPCWGTSYATVTDYSCYDSVSNFIQLFKYLKESEIVDMLKRMNKNDESEKNCIIKNLVRCIHFSEDFLVENSSILDDSDIMKMHAHDILSGSYASLALLRKLG